VVIVACHLYATFGAIILDENLKIILKRLYVKLKLSPHPTETLGWRGGIAPTHS
jgi:hypothetical protein